MIQAIIGRHSDPVDVLTNTGGFLLGFWMIVAAIKLFGLRPSAFLGFGPRTDPDQKIRIIAALRFLYVCLYLVVALVPFDISVNTSRVFSQLHDTGPGSQRILLNPIYHFSHWQQFDRRVRRKGVCPSTRSISSSSDSAAIAARIPSGRRMRELCCGESVLT